MVQNDAGEQANQLATGDRISGGDGTDTLSAKVIAASALNAGPSMAIAPESVGVEKVAFTALTTTLSTVSNAETAEINAKFMNGLNVISSVHSDASLLVTNVNTLKDDGVYANKRLTEALTVRMDHSGNDAVTAESDMTVLLDNDYLLRGDGTSSAALTVALSPQIEQDTYNAATPLANNPYDKLTFKLNGVSQTINISSGTPAAPVQTTYAALKAAIEAGLAAAGLSDIVVTQNVGAYPYFSRDGFARTSDTFTLSKAGAVLTSQGAGAWGATAGLPDDNSFGATVITADPLTTTAQIAINVELEKVGRGSDGGDLTIGGMATDGKNEWDFSSSATLEEGIEKFNITVSGDASQFSSLASLQSTNNTLQTVVVTSATGSAADLIIGNHNTEGAITNALKDVRDFNSSNFANDVTLNASVTDESVAKYMKLKDQSTDAPAKDNANFAYTFGTGNDTLNLNISKANLAVTGTTVREDFQMAINTAAGNDKVTVQIGDGQGLVTDAWFTNSDLNRNLNIDTGAGNDTVSAKGTGTWNIALGEGNDTVYSDNSGAKAVWVLNTADQAADGPDALEAFAVAKDAYATALSDWLDANAGMTEADFIADAANATDVEDWATAQADFAATVGSRDLTNLTSGDNDTYKLYKGALTVTFKGLVATGVIDSTDYVTSDLQINQAIKKAINGDAVLSKLLVATDGPANTLIVTSLIDGLEVDTTAALDLSFGITQPVLTGSDATLSAAKWALSTTTALPFTAFATKGDYVAQYAINKAEAVEITGDKSANATKNVIEGGVGNDVIVLSTGNDLVADTTGSIDTVVYNAAFDTDTIVNFTAGVGGDVLDFTALGGSTYGTYGTVVETDGAINVVATLTDDNTEAAVKTELTDNTTANKGVYIAVDTASNIGTVYQIVDGAAASDLTVTQVGKIDLADTFWFTLTAANFA